MYGVLSTEGKPKAKGQGQGKEWPSWPGGRGEIRTSGDAGPYLEAGEGARAARGAAPTRAWGAGALVPACANGVREWLGDSVVA